MLDAPLPTAFLDILMLQRKTRHPTSGRNADNRREAYRGLFKAHRDDRLLVDIRTATNGNYVLGTTRFQEEIGRMLGRRMTKGKAGRPRASAGEKD